MVSLFSEDDRTMAIAQRLSLIGPIKDLLDTSAYYALSWWNVLRGRNDRYANSLFKVLLLSNKVNQRGEPKASPRPPSLRSTLGVQFLDFHDSVTRSLNRLDEMAELLRISMLMSPWYYSIMNIYIEMVKKVATGRALAPFLGEVFPLAEELRRAGLDIKTYERREESIKDLAEVGITSLERAASACEISRVEYDTLILFESFHWFIDPYREVKCLVGRLRRGGKVIVGNTDAAALPSIATVFLWSGNNVFTADMIEDLLPLAGLARVQRFSKTPYYFSIFERT